MTLKGYIPCSLVDWTGMLPAVIFIGGCNLNCWYCHNKDLAHEPEIFPNLHMDEIIKKLKKRPGWIDGVVITGGEPTLDDDLFEYIRRIKDEGLKIKLDTNGTNPSVIRAAFYDIDLFAMDIKAPLADYESVTGPVDIEAIKRSIAILKDSGKVMFRTTAAEGIDVAKIQNELDAPILIQPWRPTGGKK